MDKEDLRLRVHQLLPHSRANGPGRRAVLWVQGCSLGCPGCFNPETHAFAGAELLAPDDLFQQIAALAGSIEGLTVSGGEPFQQAVPLAALLTRIRRETSLSVLIFTGFAWDELQQRPSAAPVLACTDVLIAGRFVAEQRIARPARFRQQNGTSADRPLHARRPRSRSTHRTHHHSTRRHRSQRH